MYPNSTIRQIQSLLAAGMSQREIAARLRVSQALVLEVSTGKRGLRQGEVPPPDPRLAYPRLSGTHRYRRCPSCGGMVQMPCFACQLAGL